MDEAHGGDEQVDDAQGDAATDGPGQPAITPADREPVLSFWEEEFGVPPSAFDRQRFLQKGASKVWVVDDVAPWQEADAPGAVTLGEGPEPETVGMPLLRVGGEHWKPTTDALQRYERHVSQNVVELDAAQARAFVAGETVEAEYPELPSLGYVAVRYDGAMLGCGLYFPGELRSQIPTGRRVELALPE